MPKLGKDGKPKTRKRSHNYVKGLPAVPESVLKRRKRRDFAKKAAVVRALKVKYSLNYCIRFSSSQIYNLLF